MKILLVTQYFWPENFKINAVATDLKNRGHDIVILTGLPNYPGGKIYPGYSFFKSRSEYWNGIKIYRARLIPRSKGGGVRLLLNYFSFAFFASLKVFSINQTFDKILVYEPSPVTVGIPAIFGKRVFKAEIYFWVQDLWPESLTDAGGVRNRLVLGLTEKLTRYIYRHSKVILIQSEAFRNYIEKQGVAPGKIRYFPNTTEAFYKVEPVINSYKNKFPAGFNILFAGNIGEAQSFETLLEAAALLKKEGYSVYWNIFGEGRQRKYYEQKVANLNLQDNFIFHGSFPSEEMPKYFACADALLVSLKKSKIFSLTIPSKVQSYLACGKPIIASIDGEGARIIQEAKAGFTSPAEDKRELYHSVLKVYNMGDDERNAMGVNARNYFEGEFNSRMLIDNLEKILNA